MSDLQIAGSPHSQPPGPQLSRPEETVTKIETMNARKSETAAKTVQRQANFSADRADALERQAEQLETRAANRAPNDLTGLLVDITI